MTTNFKPLKNCMLCVHYSYEETEDETEVAVCNFHRTVIGCEKQAASCPDYYTANMDPD